MTLKQYADAEAALKEVTNLGYSLLPDYAAIYDPSNKNNAESIFEVQYLQALLVSQAILLTSLLLLSSIRQA